MPEIWTAADVTRAYRSHLNRTQREHPGYTGEDDIREARAAAGHADRLPLPPYTRLVISDRAAAGTAHAHALYTDLLEDPARVAPVLRVPAGYTAYVECVRYVTLVQNPL